VTLAAIGVLSNIARASAGPLRGRHRTSREGSR
jgi:hypothetical protein